MNRRGKCTKYVPVIIGMVIASLVIFAGNKLVVKTSESEYCASCHVHPQATQSWKRSTHYDNKTGIQVKCVDCHLPPHGDGYLVEKTKTGIRDVWGKLFKDSASFNWEAKSQIEFAKGHVFESSCIECHKNNFPIGLTPKGMEAHLYYENHVDDLHCINCHITVGHYDPDRMHEQNRGFGGGDEPDASLYTEPGKIEGFKNFTEYIPNSVVSFRMKAIPGGSFMMGSPEDEPFRDENEGPQKEISIKRFFMAEVEVSWDEYLAFFSQTGRAGKSSDTYLNQNNRDDVDAISGPTPPYGAPDQGWGTGKMPAITMTHHAATVYCEWLSNVTGKKYRLPREAEWEYAARGGTSSPYFFEGNPKRYVDQGLRNRLFGPDTSVINSYAWYQENSRAKPGLPGTKWKNPFGLEHMIGNVAEFCSDVYIAPESSAQSGSKSKHPEYVIRGGSFRDDASRLRSAARDRTNSDAWLKTDPQIPKSIWWYSDCSHVGFRVVCEYNELNNN